jgi:hypothetical protein
MEDYPSNSHKSKERLKNAEHVKKVDKVISGEVIRRKKPLGQLFKETFFSDSAHSVLSYVVVEVLLPAAKDMAADAVSQGVERFIFGEAKSTSRRTGQRPGLANHVPYNRITSNYQGRKDEPLNISRKARSSHNFDEIILATRVEAEEVVERLFDLITKYDSATVADLYDLVGVVGSYTDDEWGWTDIRRSGVARVRNGYRLNLPRPEPLD